jgi:hypothetical protein
MICCIANRRFPLKNFLSQSQSRIVIAIVCGILTVAAPAFAQRGGGHGGGGHWGGGGHFGGGHRGGGGFSHGGARGGRSWGESQSNSGIVVVSGAGARGSAWSRSFPGVVAFRGSAGAARQMRGAPAFVQGGRFGAGSDEFQSSTASRHVTIGFPPARGAWNRAASSNRGAPVTFAGQGDAIWRSASGRGSERSSTGRQAQSSPHTGQWQAYVGERGGRDRDHFHDHHFRGRWFYGGDDFGFFGYPFYGYGVGLFSDCPDWLSSDWESQGYYSGDCGAYTGSDYQGAAIAAYGADQGYSSHGTPQADTQQIFGGYAGRNPSEMAAGRSGFSDARNGNGTAAVDGNGGSQQPDTLLYLADGTNYAVTNYWLAGGDLHYMTSYGAEDSVPIGQINLQRTVDANAAQGVQFILRPKPRGGDSGGAR